MILSHFVTSPIFSFYLSIPHNYYESPTSKEEKLFSAKTASSTHSRGFFSISQSINLADISSQTFFHYCTKNVLISRHCYIMLWRKLTMRHSEKRRPHSFSSMARAWLSMPAEPVDPFRLLWTGASSWAVTLLSWGKQLPFLDPFSSSVVITVSITRPSCAEPFLDIGVAVDDALLEPVESIILSSSFQSTERE